MDHSYLSYYGRNSSPWPSQAKNELGPSNEAGPEGWTYPNTFGLRGTSTNQVSEDHGQALLSNGLGSLLTHTASNADKRPVQTDHDRDSRSNMAFDCQSSSYEAHRAIDILHWIPVAYTTDQSSSSSPAPQLFQNNIWNSAVTNQSVPPLDLGVHPLDLHFLQRPSLNNTVYTEQQCQRFWPKVGMIDDNQETIARIGSVLSNGKFMCNDESCTGQTFGRPSELRRHHTTLHATNKPNFWCHDPTCPRSVERGGEAFHRKDKLAAHVNSMHS